MSVDNVDWGDFGQFKNSSDLSNTSVIDSENDWPKNSPSFLFGTKLQDDKKSYVCTESLESLKELLKGSNLDECFSVVSNKDGCQTKEEIKISLVNNDLIWEQILSNFGCLMPIDWQTSSFNHQLVCQVLNMKKNPDNIKTNDEDIYKSDSEDDEINVGDSPLCHEDETLYDGDMKNETPIFTAEQVISEIEEMMEEMSVEVGHEITIKDDDTRTGGCYYDNYPVRKLVMGDISSMSVLELGELYEEMEVLCKEYSQALVSQLALRDELEYDLEVKNRFISLFLVLQKKKRSITGKGNKKTDMSKLRAADKVLLTTSIPYNPSSSPSSHLLLTYIKILSAMQREDPNLPMLLTDYILKVVCPT